MSVCGTGLRFVAATTAAAVALMLLGAATASAQVLFFEGFDDETLEANAMIVNGTVANGVATLNDPAGARATFSVLQDFNAEVMTFSFDLVGPIVQMDPRMEVLLRVGEGTTHGTLSSAQQVVEAILFRDGPRAPVTNNGSESVFLIANNKATELVFPSPIDGSDVTLPGHHYVPYILNRDTNVFVQHKAVDDFNGGPRPMTRLGIGSSTTNDIGSFSMDNVLVMPGATFERPAINPGTPGDVNGDMLVDINDFNIIRDHFQQTVTMRTEGDLNRDGFVDFRDYRQWKSNVPAPAEGIAGAAPEPSSALLASLAVLATLRWRSRR